MHNGSLENSEKNESHNNSSNRTDCYNCFGNRRLCSLQLQPKQRPAANAYSNTLSHSFTIRNPLSKPYRVAYSYRFSNPNCKSHSISFPLTIAVTNPFTFPNYNPNDIDSSNNHKST
jgi:hypothetical protein